MLFQRFQQDESYKHAIEDIEEILISFNPLLKRKILYSRGYLVTPKDISSLFKIDYDSHDKARLALYYHLRTQPSEVDRMLYMDFSKLIMDLSDMLKEKQKAEQDQMDAQKANTPDYSKQMKSMGNMKAPKMPKM